MPSHLPASEARGWRAYLGYAVVTFAWTWTIWWGGVVASASSVDVLPGLAVFLGGVGRCWPRSRAQGIGPGALAAGRGTWLARRRPRPLRGRVGPSSGVLIVGVVWATWHLPLFFDGTYQYDLGFLTARFWLFNVSTYR